MVVIVVPAFAEGDEREEPVVAARVCGGESSFTKHMSKGIDREDTVVEENRRQEKADEQRTRTAEYKDDDGEDGRRN